MALCKHCRKPLNQSQYSADKKYKSCPKCSVEGGEEHIYYPYPSSFGTTLLRATHNTPDGAQSYCIPCRGSETGPYSGCLRCSIL